MNRKIFTLSAIVSVLLTLSSFTTSCNGKSASSEAADDNHENAEVAADVELSLYVPAKLNLVKCIDDGTKYMKSPDSDVYAVFVDMSEASYNQWSNQKVEKEEDWGEGFGDTSPIYFTSDDILPVLSEKKGYYELPLPDVGSGYVPASKCEAVTVQAVTAQDLTDNKRIHMVKSGKYEGLIFSSSMGEGGVYYQVGKMENDMILFTPHAAGYGISFIDDNCYAEDEETGIPMLQYDKISEAEMTKLINYIIKTPHEVFSQYTIITKVDDELQYIQVEPEQMKSYGKKNTYKY